MKKYVIDCSKGDSRSLPLTPDEVAELEDRNALWQLQAVQRERDALREELGRSDARMARVTEDLINALLVRGAIYLNELPESAVKLLADRKGKRDKLVL